VVGFLINKILWVVGNIKIKISCLVGDEGEVNRFPVTGEIMQLQKNERDREKKT
jgi:hypothetical protein